MKFALVAACLSVALTAHAGEGDAETAVPEKAPDVSLLKPPASFPLGKYWTQRTVGKKEFYLAEHGNYSRTSEKASWPYYQTGLFPGMIPGFWNIKVFDPDTKLVPWQEKEVNEFLTREWPLFTINYQRMQGWPAPTPAAMARVNDLWMGDGSPEEPIYRLEPVFNFMESGKKWIGSSMQSWKDECAVDYLKNDLMPLLNKEMPGCTSPDYQWDRKRIEKLKELYCLSYLAVNPRPICFTMYLSPFAIMESRKDLPCVGSKGGDAYLMAMLRGVSRQCGGDKFLTTWRGHEPTERYEYFDDGGWFVAPERDNWGYPLALLRYYIFRPFLCGANYYANEAFPGSLAYDLEGHGNYRLCATGKIVKELIEYSNRVPQRGTPYTPVALVQGWYRGLDHGQTDYGFGKISWGGHDQQDYPPNGNIPFDRADWMNFAFLNDLFFPETPETRFSGDYFITSPFGEIIDVLKPNPEKPVDPLIFDGYKMLVLTGGITLSPQYRQVLQDYVKGGGIIVVNAMDAKDDFDADFTGVEAGDEFTASSIRNVRTGKEYKEKEFQCLKLTLRGATALYSAGDDPAVTINQYGKGGVIVTAPEYLLTAGTTETVESFVQTKVSRPMLLDFCGDLFRELFDSVTPFVVKTAPEYRPDISWAIFKKGDDWTVTMFDYSLRREELVAKTLGTAKVVAEYPYKSIPFEIDPNVPATDVVELFAGRNVNCRKSGDTLQVRESIQCGDIRVYEFSQRRINLAPYQRCVNYALHAPVKVSSTYRNYKPEYAVDGVNDNDHFWCSGNSKADMSVAFTRAEFDMPQWLTVDLGQAREIDHVKLSFHVWPDLSVEVRKNIYRYQVQASRDGNTWETVIDESANEAPAEPGGTETWFKPTEARYVKLLVLRNASSAGAQVVEFGVMGKETERCQPQRKPVLPAQREQ